MHKDIYEELKRVARAKDVTNYSALGRMFGLDVSKKEELSAIANILDEINHYERKHNRPMLSAVVINKQKNMPGAGFFVCAQKLGKYLGYKELLFWLRELFDVWNYWQSH